jgi:hypothetical protein
MAREDGPGELGQATQLGEFLFDTERLKALAGPAIAGPGASSEPPTEDVVARPWLRLDESTRYVCSLSGPVGADLASILPVFFWAGLDSAVRKLENAGDQARAFATSAVGARAESRLRLRKLLETGEVVARTIQGDVPADAWVRWEPDWGRSELGPAREPNRFRDIVLSREDLRRIFAPAGALDRTNFRTGAPGRPTGRHLIVDEHERRSKSGECLDKLSEEAAALCDWYLRKTESTPGAPSLTLRTIENIIRSQHNNRVRGNCTKS